MQLIKELILSSGLLGDNDIKDITPLAGDASGKKFYRIRVLGKEYRNLILLQFAAGMGPLHTGESMTQDQSFVQLSKFLAKNNLPVPKLYYSDLDRGFAIEEDLGDRVLASFIETNEGIKYLQAALSLIPKIQSLPEDSDIIAFKRRISFENYLEESFRFITFYLPNTSVSSAEQEEIKKAIRLICEHVASQKQTYIYRDFTAWNVMVDYNQQVRLVDFQDLIQGSYVYDLVSILHDRDIDFLLGDNNIKELLKPYCLKDNFFNDYLHTLLQRHLRLAGQFLNLTEKTGKVCYKNWVPGCMRRLGRAFATLKSYESVSEILSKYSADFKEGSKSPYRLFFRN